MVPENLYYTKEHEWIKVEDSTALVGITDYAQDTLGEITFVELPVEGKSIEQGDEVAVAESSKAASDVYGPLSGKITQVNSELEDNPELINEDCYQAGWIWKMTIDQQDQLEKLMNAQQYEKFLEGID
jgi:glycine cleavage system H protein